MNGYALAANFRQARHSWRFTSIEADLYHELVAVANERGWPTEFQYSNQLICATIGTSEKSLIAARNRLKQAGLLDFVSGQKRAPTCYRLNKGLPEVSKNASKKGSVSDSVSASVCDSPLYKELKQKETELEKKLQQAQQAAIAAEGAAQKKIEELELATAALNANPPQRLATGAATDVPTRKARPVKSPAPVLTGPLADYLNPGGLAHTVQALKNPLTQAEADVLVAEYGAGPAAQIVQEMANYAGLAKYTSVNLTARNWLKKRTDDPRPSTSQQPERGAKPTAAAATGARALAERLAVIDEQQRQERLLERRGGFAAGAYTGQSPH